MPQTVIVTGLIAQYPLGGMAWDFMNYVLGLKRLGLDVYYFEDTGLFPYNPGEGGVSKGCEFNVRYLANLMERFGLENRWAYHFVWGDQWFGLPKSSRKALMDSADLLINVSGSLSDPQNYRGIKRLAYIDTDPVFTQVKLARGQEDFRKLIDLHDYQFSFGELLAKAGWDTGHRWLPTRQAIVLSEWEADREVTRGFTTVMNWTSYKPIKFAGQVFGQKDIEFEKFLELPNKVSDANLEIAVNRGKTRRTPVDKLRHRGWCVVDPDKVCPDMQTYRDYIQSSKAEWSVAKNGYVVGKAGWFSTRSACYLAAGRPVVLQDTGFSEILPTDEGLLSFSNLNEAVEAIERVQMDYHQHSRAAREIAHEYFDSDQVLARLLDQMS